MIDYVSNLHRNFPYSSLWYFQMEATLMNKVYLFYVFYHYFHNLDCQLCFDYSPQACLLNSWFQAGSSVWGKGRKFELGSRWRKYVTRFMPLKVISGLWVPPFCSLASCSPRVGDYPLPHIPATTLLFKYMAKCPWI